MSFKKVFFIFLKRLFSWYKCPVCRPLALLEMISDMHGTNIRKEMCYILIPGNFSFQTYTSVFTPPYDTRHRYKPLFQPGSEGLTPESDYTPSPSSASSTPLYGPLRRSGSSLATIREEHQEGENVLEDGDRRPVFSWPWRIMTGAYTIPLLVVENTNWNME